MSSVLRYSPNHGCSATLGTLAVSAHRTRSPSESGFRKTSAVTLSMSSPLSHSTRPRVERRSWDSWADVNEEGFSYQNLGKIINAPLMRE